MISFGWLCCDVVKRKDRVRVAVFRGTAKIASLGDISVLALSVQWA